MKIFHYRNISNTARHLANAQKRLGHDAIVADTVGRGDCDWIINKKKPGEVLRALMGFDLYHIHSGVFLPKGLEAIIAKVRGKKILYHHWGSDLRRGRKHYFDPDKPKPPRLQNLGDHVVHSPDLLEYIPDAYLVFTPIDLEVWREPASAYDSSKKDSVIRILHAPLFEAQTDDVQLAVKGTKYVHDAVTQLKREGYNIESITARNIPHNEMMKLYLQADIVVDQLILGWYGMTTIEAMTQLKPVCVYVKEDLLKYTMEPTPFVNCTPQTIKDNLRYFIENEVERRRIGELGRRYVEEKHDANKVVQKIMKLIE